VLSVFNTTQVAPHERFAYWVEGICQTFLNLDCRREEKLPLSGQMTCSRLDNLEFVEVTSPAMEYHRGPAELARISGQGMFLLSLCLSGKSILSQHGKYAIVLPGDVTLWSAVAPSVIAHQQPSRTLVVSLPYQCFVDRLPCAHDALSISLSGGSALGAMVGSLIREAHALAQQEGGHGADAVQLNSGMLDIVSFAFAPQHGLTSSMTRKNPLAQIKRHLLDHLGDPQLSFSEVARRHHMSLRTLRRLFAAEGITANRWLWCKRLEASRALLDSGQARQVSEAALSCGFNDLSHFCRAFKTAYGIKPSQYLHNAFGVPPGEHTR